LLRMTPGAAEPTSEQYAKVFSAAGASVCPAGSYQTTGSAYGVTNMKRPGRLHRRSLRAGGDEPGGARVEDSARASAPECRVKVGYATDKGGARDPRSGHRGLQNGTDVLAVLRPEGGESPGADGCRRSSPPGDAAPAYPFRAERARRVPAGARPRRLPRRRASGTATSLFSAAALTSTQPALRAVGACGRRCGRGHDRRRGPSCGSRSPTCRRASSATRTSRSSTRAGRPSEGRIVLGLECGRATAGFVDPTPLDASEFSDSTSAASVTTTC